jgi:hypothetical protein
MRRLRRVVLLVDPQAGGPPSVLPIVRIIVRPESALDREREAPMRRLGVAVLLAAAVGVVGCGGSTIVKTVTERAERAAPTAPTEREPPRPVSLTRAAHLAADNVRPSEIIIKQSGTANLGPYHFKQGIYRVRFQQWVSSGERNFATEASSLVVQLDRKPAVIDAETVSVFSATQERGSTQVTIPGGHFYVDVSSEDYGVVLRFTPVP